MRDKKLSWFKYMWSIFLIQSFAVCTAILCVVIYQKSFFKTQLSFWLMLSFVLSIMAFISYFGFYKRWKVYSSEE